MQVPWPKGYEDVYVENGYLTRRDHPNLPFYILNYTNKTVYDRRWNEITLACRGLVVNRETREIVSRPFGKFFNLNEVGRIPNGKFQVYDKLDGSLGITYHCDGQAYITTRGSFESDQAIRGTELLRSQFCCTPLDPNLTYLFEIICPESRYVVDYKEFQGLVLIAVIETETGRELDLSLFPSFIRAESYEFNNLERVAEFVESRPNSEGVVVKFEDGTRIKVKSAEYLRKFHVISGLTKKSVWDVLSKGGEKSLQDIVEDAGIPEETRLWLAETMRHYVASHLAIMTNARSVVENRPDLQTRKEVAKYFLTAENPHILFALLDRREQQAKEMAWELLKPGAS